MFHRGNNQQPGADDRGFRTDYQKFSQLAGEFGTLDYRVAYRRVSSFSESAIGLLLGLLALGLEVVFLIWLVQATRLNIDSQGALTVAAIVLAFGAMIGIEAIRIINTISVCFFTLSAKDPVPVPPPSGKKIAFATTIVPSKEPFSVVKKTLRQAKKIRYDGTLDVWLLDEGNDSAIRQACEVLGVHHFSRSGVEKWNTTSGTYRARTKHGNYNAWFAKHGKAYDFVIAVDPDHQPLPNFIERMLGYFRDRDVAFVCGPQVYGNYDENFIARCAESQQYIFHSSVQRAGNAGSSPMFVGTNYAYRVAAWGQVGGFQDSITEDLLTGLAVHAARNPQTGNFWKSVYTPDTVAVGEGPTSWTDFFAQQLRWSRGVIEILLRDFMRLFRRLPIRNKLYYALLVSYYPTAAAIWLLGICITVVFLTLGPTGIAIPVQTWLLLFASVNLSQFLLYVWFRRHNVSPHDKHSSLGLSGLYFAMISLPVYAAAVYSVLGGGESKFAVTPKGESASRDGLRAFKKHMAWACLLLAVILFGYYYSNPGPWTLTWSLVTLLVCTSPFLVWGASQRYGNGGLRRKPLLRLELIAAVIVLVGLGTTTAVFLDGSKAHADITEKLLHKSLPHPVVAWGKSGWPVPTNKWCSALVFSRPSYPVYANPLTFKTTERGFELSAPEPQGRDNEVTAPHMPDITADLSAETRIAALTLPNNAPIIAQVTSYDDLSVVVRYTSGGQHMAEIRLVRGSPYAFVTVEPRVTLRLQAGSSQWHGDNLRISSGGRSYGLWADARNRVVSSDKAVMLHAGQERLQATIFTLNERLDGALLAKLASNRVIGTNATYAQSGDTTVTTLTYKTVNGGDTIFGLLPHHQPPSAPTVGTLDSLYGPQHFVAGTAHRYSLTRKVPGSSLEVGSLLPVEKDRLRHLLDADIARGAYRITAPDTYFAGKELFRLANLVQLAHELQHPQARSLEANLANELTQWFDAKAFRWRDNKYFYYDATIRGITGEKTSFSSDKFNDHHFHHGYFIYAASVLAQHDREFYTKNRAMIDALVADIASATTTRQFPKLRTFDTFVGHSWAAGYGITAKGFGNNQESSSEAVQAWHAVHLWAKISGDKELQQLSAALYRHEIEAAARYWLSVPQEGAAFQIYKHPFTSLISGGRRQYHTFFSDLPEAKLAIQLIPMGPGHAYLGDNAGVVSRNTSHVYHQNQDRPQLFADFLIMYEALADPVAAQTRLVNLTPDKIDGANSLTYLQAWVFRAKKEHR